MSRAGVSVSHDAYERLSAAVLRAKAGSPLAAVTVVVPSFGAGRDALQYLGSHGGVANTRVLTVAQVVDRLAAPALSPRLALPYPLLEAAVARVLADEPGVFAPVADQAITAQAIAGASWRLARFAGADSANASALVADMLRVHRVAVGAHSAKYFLQHEAYTAATARIAELGSVVVFLPSGGDPAESAFLGRLQRVGETVDDCAEVLATMVVHASDADDEVRSVARLVRSRLAAGVPGSRVGVFYGTADPYLQLIHEHFARADVEFAGPQCHSLLDRPVARSLLRLLELDTEVMPRRELLAILAERAVRWLDVDGQRLNQVRIEQLTRVAAPIVGGPDWDRLSEVPADSYYSETAATLSDFVTALQRDLRSLSSASTWADCSDQLVALLDRFFVGGPDFATVRAMAAGLGDMDGVAPPSTTRGVAEAMAVRIGTLPETVGTFGAGVSVGPIAAGVGRDLDVVVVVGAAEGIVPAARREDPMLPSRLVETTPAAEIEHQRRQLQLTLAAGTGDRVVTFPRGSLRGGAEKVPSRWLLPSLEALAGGPVGVTSWQTDTADATAIVTVESFDAATQYADARIGASPATDTEWRLRALAGVPASGRQTLLDDAVVRAGMQMRSDRLNGRFTRFNGNVADVRDLVTYFADPVPPTRLEEWVTSPYLFFVRRILKVDDLPDPDNAAAIDPLTRGNLVHLVLEIYIRECIAGAPRSLDRLLDIGEDVLAEARFGSPGWLPQLWEKDSSVIRRDLMEWFARDNRELSEGWTPTAAEQDFGPPPDEVVLDLADGSIRFSGTVDRIDRHSDGRLRVTDYKTGKADSYGQQTADTPTVGGRRFQLPVYGLYARSLVAEPVVARYWFVSSKGKFAEIGYTVTDSVIDALRDGVGVVHRAISAGYFPPMPPHTHWEDQLLDLIGEPGMERAWVALESTPELAEFIAIHNGDASGGPS
ncbi:PD-(D/E)XK nuclease family protein [Antrihabitans sp. YC2-6]|uniref:PD-(D/E)XK nuclease family protein n=1 Tax=Antrihabitans sp. YC2-6 TaxID=2799498 RepID=UPI0027DD499F|nr:PD-(D/E)XK nuclease family protein [Antrihabitans sp. YC2-6]